MSGMVNFTLLGAAYFCIPINVVEVCSGMQLSYVDTVCYTAPVKPLV